MMTISIRRALALVLASLLAILGLAGCSSSSVADRPSAATTRTITDMAGRSVELPTHIERVATVGSVPVINSFLFALGKGDLIVNGLPDFASGPRYKYQDVFAPGISDKPRTQNSNNEPNAEALLGLNPQMVLVMDPKLAPTLERAGLAPVVLRWQDAEDVKQVVNLLGTALDAPDRAQTYTDNFDAALKDVAAVTATIPADKKVSALHLSPSAMTRPHKIAEWWIDQAGGRSVTAPMGDQETVKLDAEKIVAANPQVIFVNTPGDVDTVLTDPRLTDVAAVRGKQVYSIPIAAHTWGNRTSEQPLTVRWAASKLYPDLFPAADLNVKVKDFYSRVFHTDLTDDQVGEIVRGM